MTKFPEIERGLRLPQESRSDLEIVRLLGNSHYVHNLHLLNFVNDYIGLSGTLGENLLCQNDPLNFRRLLSELYLLAFLLRRELNATAATSKSGKIHDINLEVGTRQARIEIGSPTDHFGFQFVKIYSALVFRYSACPGGFYVLLQFVASEESGYHAHEVPNHTKILTSWQSRLEPEVDRWLANAEEGSIREFDGIDNAFVLRATLKAVYEDPENRCVEFHEPTRSNDTRLFFEVPRTAEGTARSQIGRKIRDKLLKRQCGEPSPDYLRILVVNFSLMDAADSDWFCWPGIAKRMDETVRILQESVGPPLTFDVMIPARLDFECCFGEGVILDQEREPQIRALMEAAGLDRKCAPPVLEPPPPELIAALKADSEDFTSDDVFGLSDDLQI